MTVRIIWASDKGEEKGVISVGSVDGNGGSPLAIDCDIHKSHVWDFFQINFYTRSFYQCIQEYWLFMSSFCIYKWYTLLQSFIFKNFIIMWNIFAGYRFHFKNFHRIREQSTLYLNLIQELICCCVCTNDYFMIK